MTSRKVHDLTDDDLPRVLAFLESHLETSLFPLSNLGEHGPRLSDHPNSGNFRWCEEDGQVSAVFCLTRRGNLILQTGGRSDHASTIVNACASEPMRIEGVVGEWSAASSVWSLLTTDPRFEVGLESREVLYRLNLTAPDPAPGPERRPPGAAPRDGSKRAVARAGAVLARPLGVGDFEPSDRLTRAFLIEEGMPEQVSLEQRRAGFERKVRCRHLWGVFDGSELVAITGLNASYRDIGQVGGVFTIPERRRQGLQRLAMKALLEDARVQLGLRVLILFTGDGNLAAQGLYESLGFDRIGHFGLLFGSWKTA